MIATEVSKTVFSNLSVNNYERVYCQTSVLTARAKMMQVTPGRNENYFSP